jgi:hypothetical protein
LVRDSLTLDPDDDPFHPATPDAAGFALLGLCAADRLGLSSEAEGLVESILSAYAGHTEGVEPERSADGHWVHFMNVETGHYAGGGWDDTYSPIGSALFVAGALFAKNHFIENANVAALADELYETTDFNAAIHSSLDGRIYLGMLKGGGGDSSRGTVRPWNEYMLVVTLALRQPNNDRAEGVADKWLNASNAPTISYKDVPTLTDNRYSFAPAFWVQQQYFFNPDFAGDADFVGFLYSHQDADRLYCSTELKQAYRYGLTAGVSPSGYTVDRIYNHHNVFSPEAVAAWGDLDAMLKFAEDQPPESDERFRYGLTRVSSKDADWVPYDAGLVDHTFLMYGLVESLEPLFFRQRHPFQTDDDGDGIGDAYDNCPGTWNRLQDDFDRDGAGDACDCGAPWADADADADVDLRDFAAWQACPGDDGLPERCFCFDRDRDRELGGGDVDAFGACLDSSGPDVPADPLCGE